MTAGKEGRIYLLDRDRLGEFSSTSDAGALQTITLGGQGVSARPPTSAGNVYFSAGSDALRAYGISNAALTSAPVSSSSVTIANPGSVPVVSSNGTANGIVWACELGDGSGLLHAFDASNLANELYRDTAVYTEFGVPTEADGKVYIGALNNLLVYGLSPPSGSSIASIVNSASFNSSVAPGSLISIFGANLAQGTPYATQIPLPISLADTSVIINGVRAGLLYVSPTQINLQIPPQTQAGSVSVVVITSGVSPPYMTLQVAAVAPQIFASAGNRLLAFNQDTSVNSPSNPAASASVITIFLTGQGAMTSTTATVNNQPVQLLYAGPAPGTVGVAQINLQLPALPPGDYPVQVTINSVPSNSGLISVH